VEDYPKNFQEFISRFKTDEDCWEYLFSLHWEKGFYCPKCNNKKIHVDNRKLAECYNCGHQVSITSVTIFHGTR